MAETTNQTVSSEYDDLKLENQLCFPLYAASREVVKQYTPYLKPLGLTYTQYITLMVLWEEQEITVHDLCGRLYLDSGTLSPVLKKLESMGYVTRERKKEDERVVIARITEEGRALEQKLEHVPEALACQINRKKAVITPKEAERMKKELYRIIDALNE